MSKLARIPRTRLSALIDEANQLTEKFRVMRNRRTSREQAERQRAQFFEHIKTCDSCRAEYEATQVLKAASPNGGSVQSDGFGNLSIHHPGNQTLN